MDAPCGTDKQIECATLQKNHNKFSAALRVPEVTCPRHSPLISRPKSRETIIVLRPARAS